MNPASAHAAPPDPPKTLLVWDRFIRVFHWALVASFATAWASTSHIGWVHKGAGYLAFALVLTRIVWGFVGSTHARFANFVPSPSALMQYLRAMAQGREPRHPGHNPLGALMILYLLGAVMVIGITGWMMTLDAFWGNGAVEMIHSLTVDLTLWAIAIHVAANLAGSLRHHENLILSMVTGRKQLVTSSRPGDDLSAHRPATAPSAQPTATP